MGVRNSDCLCGLAIQGGALDGLVRLVRSRCPRENPRDNMGDTAVDNAAAERLGADSSVKIALFSLGNLAVHDDCRAELLTPALRIGDLCQVLLRISSPDDVIHKYAQRLLQKLAT